MVVQHNLTAMNSNRMLGLTTASQAKSTEKLSSGYKINRAADDAAGLSISEKMRKQIRGLTQASANAQDGISAVQTAEGALTEVHDMLQRMNELAVKSANGTNSISDREYIQDEIDQLVTEIDRVAETTKFNETYLLKGDDTKTSTVYSYSNTEAKITDMSDADVTLFDACGTTLTAETAKDMLENGGKVYKQVTGGTAAAAGNLEAKKQVGADLYDALGHLAAKKGDIVAADFSAAKFFTDKEGKTAGADSNLTAVTVAKVDILNADGTVKLAKGEVVSTALEASIANYYATDRTRTVAVEGTDYKITEPNLYDKDGNGIAENGIESYFKKNEDGEMVYKGGLFDSNGNELIADKDKTLVESTELKKFISAKNDGQGALDVSLHVGADATKNNQIELKIAAMDATTLGIKGIKVDGATDENALDAIETIKAAIQRVSTQRSTLGAVQNRLEHTINNLDNVVENTTSAESQIRDTDMATEMVKYSNNNILAQAGQAMLAQANQSNQGVLSLLG